MDVKGTALVDGKVRVALLHKQVELRKGNPTPLVRWFVRFDQATAWIDVDRLTDITLTEGEA